MIKRKWFNYLCDKWQKLSIFKQYVWKSGEWMKTISLREYLIQMQIELNSTDYQYNF